ncbi:MAG TPA: PQQ-dependent sugar dehydrogenase [Bryobacteraceae bacterium]|nr:PQQ-dependent sugar dehydrogenase [Bryobacteraceae bacterium]
MTTFLAATILLASAARGQSTNNPFPAPIPATDGAILVKFVEFAAIPYAGDEAPRMMLLLDEPGTRRLFVNTMRGPLYSISYDGKTVTQYLDVNAATWGVDVQFSSHDRGFQSFAFHPQFNRRGTRGYGKFYTYTDTSNITPKADFLPNGEGHTHDTVLLEWTAKNPQAATYDGGAPREIFRTAKPFQIHNGGQLAFNPLAKPGSADYGLLYAGVADGGNGGDPYKHAQNLSFAFGKILRIDPLGSNSANGQYGIPSTNPFVKNGKLKNVNPGTLGEIYAYGCRNPQRFSWDPKNGNMFLADIGQDVVEKITLVTPGANLGWNIWEGSFMYGKGQVGTGNPRGDTAVTYPIVEFDHTDPLFQRSVAVTGVYAYRDTTIKQLTNKLIFGDNPSGEIFYVDADNLPKGGQDSIRRILFNDNGTAKTLLQLIQEKNKSQGKTPARRTDMRFNLGPQGKIFVLNKADGAIRVLVP